MARATVIARTAFTTLAPAFTALAPVAAWTAVLALGLITARFGTGLDGPALQVGRVGVDRQPGLRIPARSTAFAPFAAVVARFARFPVVPAFARLTRLTRFTCLTRLPALPVVAAFAALCARVAAAAVVAARLAFSAFTGPHRLSAFAQIRAVGTSAFAVASTAPATATFTSSIATTFTAATFTTTSVTARLAITATAAFTLFFLLRLHNRGCCHRSRCGGGAEQALDPTHKAGLGRGRCTNRSGRRNGGTLRRLGCHIHRLGRFRAWHGDRRGCIGQHPLDHRLLLVGALL